MIVFHEKRNESEAVRGVKFEWKGQTFVDVRVWRFEGRYITPMATGVTLLVTPDEDPREAIAGLAKILSRPFIAALDSTVLTTAFAADHDGHQGDGGDHAAH